MALAVVQATQSAPSGNTTTPTGTLATTTTGNLIVCGVLNGGNNSVTGVTDGTNTFTKYIATPNALGIPVEIWYCANITGVTSPTVTVTLGGLETGNVVELYEVSGAATTSTADGAGNGATGTSAAPSAAYTTTNANDIVFSFLNAALSCTAGTAGWTTETTYFSGQYKILSSAGAQTASYTLTGSGGWTVSLAAFKASAGATNVNGTVAISAKAVSGLTVTPKVTKDATFFCSAGAAATFRCDLGVFGHAILQGRATSTTFTAQNSRLQGVLIKPKATGTFSPFVTHSATLAIQGTASHSIFNAGSNPTILNATVHLFGFAANNVVINQFIGRATLVLRATIPLYQVSINGRATLTLSPRITRNTTLAAQGTGKMTMTATVTGAGLVSGTLVIRGRAAFTTITPRVTHDAQVVIEAGNPIFIPVEAKVAIAAKVASFNLNPKVTKGPQVIIQGRATLTPNVTLGGTNNIFAGVHFLGFATGRFAVPSSNVFGSLHLSGTATLTPTSTTIVSRNATAAILGRANPQLSAFVQNSGFNNAVVGIAGRAVVTASQFTLVQPTVSFGGLANMALFPGGTLRGSVAIHGFASFIPQVPKQLLQWSSGNTLQYKVWQYNTEDMVRVFGTSWSVNSVGLSFQSVAMEVISTEAGWGS